MDRKTIQVAHRRHALWPGGSVTGILSFRSFQLYLCFIFLRKQKDRIYLTSVHKALLSLWIRRSTKHNTGRQSTRLLSHSEAVHRSIITRSRTHVSEDQNFEAERTTMPLMNTVSVFLMSDRNLSLLQSPTWFGIPSQADQKLHIRRH